MRKAELDKAEKNFERIKDYLKKGAATQEQFEAAESGFKQASAMYAASEEGVTIGQAELEKAELSLHEAEVSVSYGVLKAPFDGVISVRYQDPGDMAVPGKPVLTINNVEEFRAEVYLRESMRERVAIEDVVEVQFGNHKLSGKIVEISPVIEPTSRTFRVEIAVSPEKQLPVGMYGTVDFPLETQKMILIPKSFITTVGQLKTVRLKNGNNTMRRHIRLGAYQKDNLVEVRSGLVAGDMLLAPRQSS
jgi:RND family efflux transporter MFP subunit